MDPDIKNTFGAYLVSAMVSSSLYGVTCLQSWHYFRKYTDPLPIKVVVIALLVLETVHAVLDAHALYYYFVLNIDNRSEWASAGFGHPTRTTTMTLPVTNWITVIVHLFYARRIYVFSGRNKYVPGIIVLLKAAQFGITIALAVNTIELHSFQAIASSAHEKNLTVGALSFAVASDVLCTAFLCYYLHISRSPIRNTETSRMIDRIIFFAINNGILTSAISIIVLILSIYQRSNLLYFSIFQVNGNLYANSLLATLNFRELGPRFSTENSRMCNIHFRRMSTYDITSNFDKISQPTEVLTDNGDVGFVSTGSGDDGGHNDSQGTSQPISCRQRHEPYEATADILDWMSSSQSPFNHLLQTNYAPSPDELHEIRKIISKPEEQVRLLNEEIIQLQAKRDKLQNFIDGHHALLSPARRIPRDIVSEIFLHCLPTDRLPVCSIAEAPLLLTTICRPWREIALTTPRLWRAVHFVFPTFVGYRMDADFRSIFYSRKEGLQLWLERARSVPVSISYFNPSSPVPIPRRARDELISMYSPMFNLLIRYSSQCKALNLKGFPVEILASFRNLKTSDVPLLEFLSLESNGHDFASPWGTSAGDNSDYALLNITRASSLRVLHLRYERVDPFTLPIRWDELTELAICPSVTPMSVTNLVEIIHRIAQTCQSLRKCTMDLFMTSANDFQIVHLETQTWPHLTELNLRLGINYPVMSPSLDKWRFFFNTITTPALSHLSLSILTSPVDDSCMEEVPFMGLLLRSNCRISFLDLDVRLSDKALIDCLRCMPFLTKLHLTDTIQPSPYVTASDLVIPEPLPTTLTTDLFRALTPSSLSTDEVLCPLLAAVSIRQCELVHIDALVSFAQARAQPGRNSEIAKLKSLRTTFQPDTFRNSSLPAEELIKAERLKQSGVDVDWRSIYDTSVTGGEPPHMVNVTVTSGMPHPIERY
ncbi:hypothetical protein Moror_8013 [Moniliophthora roreri MCA 2997]|uniref:DUF6534 domain-containing protein n=1 Tax=Moniliophthora roreri (strain MCA 2997) TaxID=1381753 RepID=V2XNV8_MONRO|nr:hypothetical protein Moror_8013 [Moniliophthora roreri MCA 2997]